MMESLFSLDDTSSSDYMDEEGEEEEDSISSSDEEVQKDIPLQTPIEGKSQKLSKPHASSRGEGAAKEDAHKPIPEDMKITPWKHLEGIREKPLIIAVLTWVKGGSMSLEQMGEEFER